MLLRFRDVGGRGCRIYVAFKFQCGDTLCKVIIMFQTGFLAFEVAICHWNACDLAYVSQWNPSPPIAKASEKTAPFAVELRHFLDDRPGVSNFGMYQAG
jgi:hypothetical protein